ncbi:unnamed protein product [Notodromas monacha]|uniref:Uncharacterized protein n=1 Tax=Notodromas monacha TaxID=399045 RepID=A0A7R9GKK5_9CRUS|nr:unnamed protein product [Notodromas monacha]CAG0924013.1 unnamed protein product [Notodromas monacha]
MTQQCIDRITEQTATINNSTYPMIFLEGDSRMRAIFDSFATMILGKPIRTSDSYMLFNSRFQKDFEKYLQHVMKPWENANVKSALWMDIPPTNPPFGEPGLNQEIQRFLSSNHPKIVTWPCMWTAVENLNALGEDDVFLPDGYHVNTKGNRICAHVLLNYLCNSYVFPSTSDACCV